MAKIYVFMPARNEEKTLPQCLENLRNQTLPPKKILVINDASTDATQDICEDFGVDVIRLAKEHKNYFTTPHLAYKLAEVMNHAFPPPPSYDYMMQHNPDIIVPRNYLETMITRMERNLPLVVASGRVKGEYSRDNHPRGAARIYKIWFWKKYIKKFPVNFSYETFPLIKAQSLGLEVKCFQDIVLLTLRPTKQYKADYGYAMRELGYSLPYVLARSIVGLPKAKANAVRLFYSYLTSPYKLRDPDLKRFMRYYQAKQFTDIRAFVKLVQ